MDFQNKLTTIKKISKIKIIHDLFRQKEKNNKKKVKVNILNILLL